MKKFYLLFCVLFISAGIAYSDDGDDDNDGEDTDSPNEDCDSSDSDDNPNCGGGAGGGGGGGTGGTGGGAGGGGGGGGAGGGGGGGGTPPECTVGSHGSQIITCTVNLECGTNVPGYCQKDASTGEGYCCFNTDTGVNRRILLARRKLAEQKLNRLERIAKELDDLYE